MNLPKEIVTRNKIRDAKICRLWLDNELTNKQIAERFGVSERLIGVIVYKNRACLKLDKEFEKQKRIRWLKQQIKRRGRTSKDSADLLDQLRIEVEGNKVEHLGNIGEQITKIIIINGNKEENGRISGNSERIPTALSL